MHQFIEKEISLPGVSVLLANIQLRGIQEFTPLVPGYYLCQRLSDDHPALRFENLPIGEAFTHVRSVGLLPPGFSVRTLPLEKPFRALNCVFDQNTFETVTKIDSTQWEEHGGSLMKIHDQRLAAMMQQIYAELDKPDFGTDLIIEATSTIILVEMARYFRTRLGGRLPAPNPARGGLAPWQLRRVRDRVEAALDIGYPDLRELSELCGISQGHLMRAFKRSTGIRIHEYITGERIKAARRMLAEGQLNAAEIAGRLGFCSPAYFSTAFRRQTGLSPMDYRRRVHAGEIEG